MKIKLQKIKNRTLQDIKKILEQPKKAKKVNNFQKHYTHLQANQIKAFYCRTKDIKYTIFSL